MAKTPDSKIQCNMRYAKNNLKRIPLDVKKDYYTDVIEKEELLSWKLYKRR